MKITKLALRGFRGFRDLELEFAPRLTCVVALNGTGKTSLIEGLAAALGSLARGALNEQSREPLKAIIVEADHMREWLGPLLPEVVSSVATIDASAEWGDLVISWRVHSQRVLRGGTAVSDTRLVWASTKKDLTDKLDSAARGNEPLPLLAALRAQRGLRIDKTPLPQLAAVDSVPAERLPKWAAQPWIDIAWYPLRDRWYELATRRAQGGERAKYALQSTLVALKRALQLSEDPQYSPDASDLVVQLPGEGWRPVGLMSDGWRAYVSTIVAVAFCCAEINPAQQDAAGVTPGVLLIDELEQHLHPELQLQIVDGLRRAFPLLQIIATTHSPLVLTDIAANESDRVLRLDRGTDGAIRVTSLLAPVGKNAVQVLTGEWFGLPSTLDDETLGMMAEHRALLRAGPEAKVKRRELEEQLRQRIGRYAETSVEELVLSVVAELERDHAFESLSHEEILALRRDVVARIKSGLA